MAGAPWLADFLDEMCCFPKAPHDDQVDALVQGLRHLRQGHSAAGLFSYYDSLIAANAKPAAPTAGAAVATA
jgi:hypothetical protein